MYSTTNNNRDTKTLNSDGNSAFRVVITEPSPSDAPPPSNLQLSNNDVQENLPIGSLVGTLSVTAGTAPIVYTIDQDLADAFQIINNELQTSRVLDFSIEPILNVGIRATDNNGKFTTQNFTINIQQVSGFSNVNSYSFNGNSFILVENTSYSLRPTYTWWAWIKHEPTELNNGMDIINSRNGTNNSGGLLRLQSGSETGDIRYAHFASNGNNKDYIYDYPAEFSFSDWHLYLIEFDGSQMKLYLDGQLQTPSSIVSDQPVGGNNPTASYIGSNATGTGEFFVGLMDEIAYSTQMLSDTEILQIYNNGIAPNLETTLATTAFRNWYRADGDTLPNITDNKGNINAITSNVTLSNDTPIGFSNNFSVSFDGASNYFLGSGAVELSTPKSFSFWIKRDTPLDTDILIGFNAQTITTNNASSIYMDDNTTQRIYFKIDSSSGDILRRWSLGTSSLNVWNHIVITGSDFSDANTIQLYRNGILLTPNQTTNSLTVLPTITNKLSIGGGVTGGSLYNGLIDEYSVWNKELSQLEVEELFNLGSPNNLEGASMFGDLIQWWRFGDRNAQGSVMMNQIGVDSVVMIGFDPSFYVGDTP